MNYSSIAEQIGPRTGATQEWVYRVLRHGIVSGELPGGAQLKQDEISAALNVSLTITSPKLYANQTVPFEAHISASARPQHAFAAVLVVVAAWVCTHKKSIERGLVA